jgi:hypothetical protein
MNLHSGGVTEYIPPGSPHEQTCPSWWSIKRRHEKGAGITPP